MSCEVDRVPFVFHLLFPLFTHWMNVVRASLAASRPVYLFRKCLVCLLFHRRSAYLDQTFNSTTTPVSLPTKGRNLPLGIFVSFIYFPVVVFSSLSFPAWNCASVLLAQWKKQNNNEDKAGLCGSRNAFLTHANEWSPTFHSSRPFAEWQN